MKTIAVLTSGGDAPGMNAAVRAVVRTACENGIKVYGVIRGYNGLINGDLIEMDLRSVSDIITRGGTILYSARSKEFATEEGMQKAIATCKKFGIEGVVVIGGDGSFRGARDLSERGIPCVGLPGTIDNDIACCDCTIGYDTCLNTIMSMVDRIRDTTESHDRCSVVEVMGRRAGYLALNSGIACGATSILIPEVEFDIEKNIIERMKKTQQTGKHHFVIIVAEGVDVDVKELLLKLRLKQVLNHAGQFSVTLKEADHRPLRTELWQPVWVIMQLSFLCKTLAIELLLLIRRILLTMIFLRLSI